MQIFYPKKSLQESAEYLSDLRLNKQILEICQICSTAIWIEDCSTAEGLYKAQQIYLPSHEHHPIIRNCKHYYEKALEYLEELLIEFTLRTNKVHSCSRIHLHLQNQSERFQKYPKWDFQNHTTNHKHISDINEAYQLCLKEKGDHR